ncbi:MAG: hypothetical protein IIA87_04805 [Nanoarchaeota archaeon]|nr:hypothetical protein [Nanoarchaeota archaeon]
MAKKSTKKPVSKKTSKKTAKKAVGRATATIQPVWNRTKTWLGNNKRVVGITAGAVIGLGALGSGAYWMLRNPQENIVFNSVLNDDKNTRVTYTEGISGDQIRMDAFRRGYTWEMYDTEDATSIDWKNNTTPRFDADRIETLIIRPPKGRGMPDGRSYWEFTPEMIGNDTIDGSRAEGALETANNFYRSRKAEIREEKRSEYIKAIDEAVNSLSGN